MASNETRRVQIPVTLLVLTRPETGEEWIVREDAYYDEAQATFEASLDVLCEQMAASGDSEDQIAAYRKSRASNFAVRLAAERKVHAAARGSAERRSYTLLRPEFGMYKQAESNATALIETGPRAGEARFNRGQFISILLPDAVKGLSSAEVDQLSPAVGEELGRRLYQAVSQDDSRLPFTFSP